MRKKSLLLKKIFIPFFILGICFSSVGAPRAQAVWGAGDITFDPTSWFQASISAGSAPVTAGATVGTTAGVAAEFGWSAVGKNLLDAAAYTAAQSLLTQLTNNTVKWIQGGFHGSPSFAVDTEAIYTEIADNIAGNLVLKLRGIATCNFTASYKDDLTNAIYDEPAKRDYIFDNAAKCPWKEDYNFKASEFYAGTSRFGWDMFGAALEDGGNPYGLETITAKEMADREEAAKAKKDKKLSWSNGYADIIDPNSCNYPPGIFLTEGSYRAPTIEEEKAYMAGGGVSVDGQQTAMTQEEANAYNAILLSDPVFVKNIQDQYCKTTTPGNIVSDQLTKTLGVDMERIGFSDNMNKIISAFLDQVMQQTIRGVFGSGDSFASTGSLGGSSAGIGGGAEPCPVLVTTLGTPDNPPVVTSTTAIIKGRVACASNSVQANVTVDFRLSPVNFSKDDMTIPRSAVSITHSDTLEETFSMSLSGLLPDTTYYYAADATTSQSIKEVHGEVYSFTTSQ